jgi:putative phosphatase
MKKPIVALMYDFDKTLCAKDMQEYSFIPSIGMNPSEFWEESNQISIKNNMDRILSYMFLMIKRAKEKGVEITKQSFMKRGQDVIFLKGVKSWFKRINEYGESLGVEVEHYILSSGVKEIIEGTSIAKYFKRIYACEFHYNKSGNADWPKQVINFTTKTQFIFRISKGSLDQMDDSKLNSLIDKDNRRVPYRNMIYIGDGMTDVPCMKLVKMKGGESIAIYHKGDDSIAKRLLKEKRVGYMCKADYSQNSELENLVKLIIHQMALTSELIETHRYQCLTFLGDANE